jgi:hypothetical protein
MRNLSAVWSIGAKSESWQVRLESYKGEPSALTLIMHQEQRSIKLGRCSEDTDLHTRKWKMKPRQTDGKHNVKNVTLHGRPISDEHDEGNEIPV